MITLKSAHEIELMRRAGKITAAARAVARDMVKPGVTTQQIDKAVYKFITEQGATPSFLHYNGYPASVCVSVNDEIIHGIPGDRVLHEGDIVSVDVGARYRGFNGDCAGTFPCGQCSDEALRLIRERDTKVPVIALTAYAFDSDLQKMLECGFDSCMTKPINVGGIKALIESQVHK